MKFMPIELSGVWRGCKVLLLAVDRAPIRHSRWPLLGCEPDGDLPRGPGDDWPFDGAGVRQHDVFGAGAVLDARLHGGIELAPSRAFSVEQGFPAYCGQPGVQLRLGHALLFEVVKCGVQALVGQPGAGFFDGVSIGNAVNNGVHGGCIKWNVTRLGDNRRL